MKKSALLASTAIGLLLCIAPANAQMQQKGSEEKAAPPSKVRRSKARPARRARRQKNGGAQRQGSGAG